MCFRPGTTNNHRRQIALYRQFCNLHGLVAIQPSAATLCYYITYLSKQFISAGSVKNYISGVSFLHKCLGKPFKAIHQFPVQCLFRAVEIALRRQPSQKFPITPPLLMRLVQVSGSLGVLAPPFRVALLLAFYGMLRVSNLAPSSPAALDVSRDICRGDVVFRPPGLVITLKWSKTLQDLSTTPLVPIPTVPGHLLDPVQAYKDLLKVAPTSQPRQPLLMYFHNQSKHVLTAPLLNSLLRKLLIMLHIPPENYSFHSLRRGGATTAYHAGVKITDVKRHGVWASDSFFKYITDPVVALSPVSSALGNVAIKQK